MYTQNGQVLEIINVDEIEATKLSTRSFSLKLLDTNEEICFLVEHPQYSSEWVDKIVLLQEYDDEVTENNKRVQKTLLLKKAKALRSSYEKKHMKELKKANKVKSAKGNSKSIVSVDKKQKLLENSIMHALKNNVKFSGNFKTGKIARSDNFAKNNSGIEKVGVTSNSENKNSNVGMTNYVKFNDGEIKNEPQQVKSINMIKSIFGHLKKDTSSKIEKPSEHVEQNNLESPEIAARKFKNRLTPLTTLIMNDKLTNSLSVVNSNPPGEDERSNHVLPPQIKKFANYDIKRNSYIAEIANLDEFARDANKLSTCSTDESQNKGLINKRENPVSKKGFVSAKNKKIKHKSLDLKEISLLNKFVNGKKKKVEIMQDTNTIKDSGSKIVETIDITDRSDFSSEKENTYIFERNSTSENNNTNISNSNLDIIESTFDNKGHKSEYLNLIGLYNKQENNEEIDSDSLAENQDVKSIIVSGTLGGLELKPLSGLRRPIGNKLKKVNVETLNSNTNVTTTKTPVSVNKPSYYQYLTESKFLKFGLSIFNYKNKYSNGKSQGADGKNKSGLGKSKGEIYDKKKMVNSKKNEEENDLNNSIQNKTMNTDNDEPINENPNNALDVNYDNVAVIDTQTELVKTKNEKENTKYNGIFSIWRIFGRDTHKKKQKEVINENYDQTSNTVAKQTNKKSLNNDINDSENSEHTLNYVLNLDDIENSPNVDSLPESEKDVELIPGFTKRPFSNKKDNKNTYPKKTPKEKKITSVNDDIDNNDEDSTEPGPDTNDDDSVEIVIDNVDDYYEPIKENTVKFTNIKKKKLRNPNKKKSDVNNLPASDNKNSFFNISLKYFGIKNNIFKRTLDTKSPIETYPNEVN